MCKGVTTEDFELLYCKKIDYWIVEKLSEVVFRVSGFIAMNLLTTKLMG